MYHITLSKDVTIHKKPSCGQAGSSDEIVDSEAVWKLFIA